MAHIRAKSAHTCEMVFLCVGCNGVGGMGAGDSTGENLSSYLLVTS